ncbi:MAG: hypothetical protein K8963_10790, partial [Proteobacteria bacterium]|nr:hypothetical protein [Pseudomonadota bacterium]
MGSSKRVCVWVGTRSCTVFAGTRQLGQCPPEQLAEYLSLEWATLTHEGIDLVLDTDSDTARIFGRTPASMDTGTATAQQLATGETATADWSTGTTAPAHSHWFKVQLASFLADFKHCFEWPAHQRKHVPANSAREPSTEAKSLWWQEWATDGGRVRVNASRSAADLLNRVVAQTDTIGVEIRRVYSVATALAHCLQLDPGQAVMIISFPADGHDSFVRVSVHHHLQLLCARTTVIHANTPADNTNQHATTATAVPAASTAPITPFATDTPNAEDAPPLPATPFATDTSSHLVAQNTPNINTGAELAGAELDLTAIELQALISQTSPHDNPTTPNPENAQWSSNRNKPTPDPAEGGVGGVGENLAFGEATIALATSNVEGTLTNHSTPDPAEGGVGGVGENLAFGDVAKTMVVNGSPDESKRLAAGVVEDALVQCMNQLRQYLDQQRVPLHPDCFCAVERPDLNWATVQKQTSLNICRLSGSALDTHASVPPPVEQPAVAHSGRQNNLTDSGGSPTPDDNRNGGAGLQKLVLHWLHTRFWPQGHYVCRAVVRAGRRRRYTSAMATLALVLVFVSISLSAHSLANAPAQREPANTIKTIALAPDAPTLLPWNAELADDLPA